MTKDTNIITSKSSDYRITKVVARHLQMHLPHPYVMASGIMHHADTVLVEITATCNSDDQVVVVGYGEGAPYHSPTAHELAPDVLQYLESTAGPAMLQKDPVALLLQDQFTSHPDPDHIVALGAIDIALWDLYGKLTGKPICDGPCPVPIPYPTTSKHWKKKSPRDTIPS
jgi:L-alanine-DL-glutamate epimerase-like enolase superfamily enzyme